METVVSIKLDVESPRFCHLDEVLSLLGRRESDFLTCLVCSPEYRQCKDSLKQKIWPARKDVSDVLLAGVAHRTRRILRANHILVNIKSLSGYGYCLDFLESIDK